MHNSVVDTPAKYAAIKIRQWWM